MFCTLRRWKLLHRIAFLCFVFVIAAYILIGWYHDGENIDARQYENHDIGNLKSSNLESDYLDDQGIRVIVGRYIGDDVDGKPFSNLTNEIINANGFDPKPNEGKNGLPVIIPSYLAARQQLLFRINRFNLMASDRIPLDRALPDVRRPACKNVSLYHTKENYKASVIIIFHNEAWSTLLRTVTSIIIRSPGHLLREIILVDDASTRTFLKGDLDDYVRKLSVPTRVLRSYERVGLIRARMIGSRNATGQVLVFLDAHCECTEGWLDGLVSAVIADRTRVACPIIDMINDETFAYVRTFENHIGAINWDLHFRWYAVISEDGHLLHRQSQQQTAPINTPVMAGGLFAIDKDYFFKLGGYDEEMHVWGGENLELSFKVWQCGGSIAIIPCSHVGHIYRKSSPYDFPGGVNNILYKNLARVAIVWMDEWRQFYFKFHPEAKAYLEQPVRSRIELRKKLNCRSFGWFLQNIWPQHFMPTDDRFFGKIRHVASDQCVEKPASKPQVNQAKGAATLSRCSPKAPLWQLFVVISEDDNTVNETIRIGSIATDEFVCLDTLSNSAPYRVHILPCSGSRRQQWKHDSTDNSLRHMSTRLCASILTDKVGIYLEKCSGSSNQLWSLDQVAWK